MSRLSYRDRATVNIAVSILLMLLCLVLIGILAVAFLGATNLPEPRSTPFAPNSEDRSNYAWYLEIAPPGAPELSREDAQTRAYLGCGQSWAPGTVDAALAEAYRGICK